MTIDSGSVSASAEAVVKELYRVHALGLVRFALMLTGDQVTAEDVVQEAFIGLYRRWDQIRDIAAILRVSRGTVSTTAARGLATLSKQLEEEL